MPSDLLSNSWPIKAWNTCPESLLIFNSDTHVATTLITEVYVELLNAAYNAVGAGSLTYLQKDKAGRIKGAERPASIVQSRAWAQTVGRRKTRGAAAAAAASGSVRTEPLQTRTRKEEPSSPTVPAAENQVSPVHFCRWRQLGGVIGHRELMRR